MRSLLKRSLFAVLLCTLAACVHGYQQPSLDEPYALAKVRVSYHGGPDSQLHETVYLNGESVDMPRERGHRDVSVAQALRVRIEPLEWSFESWFTHTETRLVTHTDEVPEQYPCGSRSAGSGNTSSSVPQYCTRYRLETRTDPVTFTITDAACSARAFQHPRERAVYLLQYDVYDGTRCVLNCYEQFARPDGAFELTPCR